MPIDWWRFNVLMRLKLARNYVIYSNMVDI